MGQNQKVPEQKLLVDLKKTKLHLDPQRRVTAEVALKHLFFTCGFRTPAALRNTGTKNMGSIKLGNTERQSMAYLLMFVCKASEKSSCLGITADTYQRIPEKDKPKRIRRIISNTRDCNLFLPNITHSCLKYNVYLQSFCSGISQKIIKNNLSVTQGVFNRLLNSL